MAHVIKRVWKSGPRKVKKVAWGYTLQVAGKQERTFDGAWTEEDAQLALDERLEQVRAGVERLRECTLAELVDEYLTHKTDTGMRKSEILELAWERVDLSTSRLTLYKTKSGKPRGVPMNRAVYDALMALQPARDRAGLLFKRSTDRAWGQIRTAFTTALARAEIKGFRFHDLRHTAASHMVMRGAGLKDVQEILGHADLKVTMRYSHLSPTHLLATVERLEGLTSKSTPGAATLEAVAAR